MSLFSFLVYVIYVTRRLYYKLNSASFWPRGPHSQYFCL